jgi:branched-chain amino acid transport system ATP-binding protein
MVIENISLKAENIISGYGGMNILNGVSVEVSSQEIVVIIGPNGAGKSTLMKSIFGILPVKKGAVILGERDITNDHPQKLVQQGLAYIPQVRNVFPNLSVHENFEMGAYLREDNLKESLDATYDLFPALIEKRNQPAGELSGGQQQMVAIGRALMSQPKFLLLDEPTAGLSPKMHLETFRSIKKIRDLGVGILMVEQNAKKALEISDRGYVLVSGENRLMDTGKALLANKEISDLFLGGQ